GHHDPRLAEDPTMPQIRESGLGDVRLSLHGPPSGSIRRPGPAVAGPGSMIPAAVAARQQSCPASRLSGGACEVGGDDLSGMPVQAAAGDQLGDPRTGSCLTDDPPSAVPVQPPAVPGQEYPPFRPFPDGQVDRPGGQRRPFSASSEISACSRGGPSPAATRSAPSSLRSGATAWDS